MSPRRLAGRIALAVVALGVLGIGIAAAIPGNPISYLTVQAAGQLDMLWGRIPVERAIASGRLDADQIEAIERVPPILEFGERIGLNAGDRYRTINPDFDRTIWNLSACDPLAFEPVYWSFPIVGRLPYIGFFDEGDARRQVAELEARGLDVWLRTAGAYSTLGWFDDPLLPEMLTWREDRLANTLLHELTHATVWVAGSVQFNESFAGFVGDVAAQRYLEDRYGPASEQATAYRDRLHDRAVYRRLVHELYTELDAVYRDEALSDAAKLGRKRALFDALPQRFADSEMRRPERWAAWAEKQTWNNAALLQFRTYNRSREWFATLLDQEGGDLAAFMARVEALAGGADDPYAALAAAVGAEGSDGGEW